MDYDPRYETYEVAQKTRGMFYRIHSEEFKGFAANLAIEIPKGECIFVVLFSEVPFNEIDYFWADSVFMQGNASNESTPTPAPAPAGSPATPVSDK